MAMLKTALGPQLELSRTQRHGSSISSNSSNSSSNIDGGSNSIIDSSSNKSINNNNNDSIISSGSDDENNIRYVLGADPWVFGSNTQDCTQCSLAGTQLHPRPVLPSYCAADNWSSSSSDFSFTNSMGDDHTHDSDRACTHGDAIMNSTTRNSNSTNISHVTAGAGKNDGGSNRSRNGSISSNFNHCGGRATGKENMDHVCSSSSNNNSININSSSNNISNSNSNKNNSGGSGNGSSGSGSSSGTDDGNASSIQHVIAADPSCTAPSSQALRGKTNGDGGSIASDIGIGIAGEGAYGGKDKEAKNIGALSGECASVESSYEEGDTSLGLSDRIGAIEMGENFGTGMDFVIGRQGSNGSEELRATVESTVALVTSAQVSAKEQIATLQRQGAMFIKVKATISALSGQLYASEAEKRKLVFAIDELNAKVMAMEEEEAARTNPEDYSRKMSLLTLRADAAETAKNRVLRDNVVLADTLAEEKRNNGHLCEEVALLKEALATKKEVDAFMVDGGFKETPAFISTTATAQTTAAAAGTPRSFTRRPLCAVDPNSERSCYNGVSSPPSPACQTSRSSLGKRTPVVWPVVPSPKTVRFTTAMFPSIVYSSPSVVSVDRGFSSTTASPKMEGPVQKTASQTSDYRNHITSPKLERSVPQTAPTARRCSARIAARDASTPPHHSSVRITATRDNKSNATSSKTESSVQQTAPAARRYSARIAAKAGRGSVTTGRGVANRGSESVQNESPMASLRVLRSTARAVEKAAAAADQRPATEPKVKDRKRFMRF